MEGANLNRDTALLWRSKLICRSILAQDNQTEPSPAVIPCFGNQLFAICLG